MFVMALATPEHINDGRNHCTLQAHLWLSCDTYDKMVHGSLIALDIGLDTIREGMPFVSRLGRTARSSACWRCCMRMLDQFLKALRDVAIFEY